MTVDSPPTRRRAAAIYATTVIGCYALLGASAYLANFAQAATMSSVAGSIFVVWWISLAGPGLLLCAALFSVGVGVSAFSLWASGVLSVPFTLLPIYLVAGASSRRARAAAVVLLILALLLGWIAYFLIYAVEIQS